MQRYKKKSNRKKKLFCQIFFCKILAKIKNLFYLCSDDTFCQITYKDIISNPLDTKYYKKISGFEARIKHYWQFDMSSPDSCANYTNVNNTNIPIFERNRTLEQIIYNELITPDRLQPRVETFTLFIECP